ncbi:hypothetical protein L3X38_019850 [Prunus dulcis]|uniref:K Homology domain-containing protein n=1 Tax=Prunus dulcis TaxID=3755 RepID=A0AAD4WE96_PRUDU|nr:hypothetical protein L3X38_019850 [Prunus dulcis]
MDGNKRNFFKKRPNVQFKRKGGNNNYKKGNWNNSTREKPSENYQSLDTVYRILCPSKRIGGVIGKGGGIVKALREETRAKITVADSVLGSDERVIIIFSSPTKISSKQTNDGDSSEENELEPMDPHCAAQDALLKVHNRIVEEDLFGGVTFDDDNENSVVTARLLVPNNMVGCLLGKGGDVIQRLRSETSASIRVLPADQLPTCAMETDELVQISGKPDVTKRALYEVSTLLHQNPRKDKPPSGFPMPFGGQGFRPPGAPMTNVLPPGNPMWSNRAPSHSTPPMPRMEGYGNRSSEFAPGGFNGVPPGHGGEALAEFSMKILCSPGKIGGVIGKGGFNVKQLQLETGASIYVQEASTDSEERVIHVSAFEAFWNPISQTIEAILELQNKTSELSDKGIITTRILVPSSKVGCILGQGGQVINEMRRRTQADIRVYSKDDRPRCAAEDEELVQISGNFGVAKDALAEITSRLRVRTLRDANAGAEPALVGPAHGFGLAGSVPGGGPRQLPSAVGAGSSSRYDPLKVGRHEYELQSYRIPSTASGYPSVNHALEGKIPKNTVDSFPGTRGGITSTIREVGAPRIKLQDSQGVFSERPVEIRGSDNLNVAQNILQAFMASAGQSVSAQAGSYHNVNALQGSYHNMNPQRSPYQMNSQQSPFQMSSQQSPLPFQMSFQQSPYQNNPQRSPYQLNAPQSPYQINATQSPYQLSAQQGSYPNINASQGAYHNYNSQQGTYQYRL